MSGRKKINFTKENAPVIGTVEQYRTACNEYGKYSYIKYECADCNKIITTTMGTIKHKPVYPLYCGQCQAIHTNLTKYGETNPSKSSNVINKIKNTKLTKYGDANYNNAEKHKNTYNSIPQEVKDMRVNKIKATKLAKYGEKLCSVEGLRHISNVQKQNKIERCAKSKQTKLLRYGDENYCNIEKIKETVNVRTVEYKMMSVKKRKHTMKEKYGVESYSSTSECKEKVASTCLARFGVKSYLATKECRQQAIDSSIKKYGVKYAVQSEAVKHKCRETCIKKYGVPYPVGHFSRVRSYLEDSIVEVIKRAGISYITNNRTILHGKEIDIVLPELHKCIEIQGTYWHCDPRFYPADYFNKANDMTAEAIWNRDRAKRDLIESYGYTYYAIWEYDWKNNFDEAVVKLNRFIDAK